MKIVIVSVAMLVLLGCHRQKRAASLEQVRNLIAGHYEGQYNKGVEHLVIKTNGTFSQEFICAGVTNYHLEGKWNLEQTEDRYLVTFIPFMDLEEALRKSKNPERVAARIATFYEGEPRIYFIRDLAYFVIKKSN